MILCVESLICLTISEPHIKFQDSYRYWLPPSGGSQYHLTLTQYAFDLVVLTKL